jgi:hypothetical protein
MNEEFQPRNEILKDIDGIFLAEMDKRTMTELANSYEKGSKDTTFEDVLKDLGGRLSEDILSRGKINDYTVLKCTVDVSADAFPLEIDLDYFFAYVTLELEIKHDKEVDRWIGKVIKRSYFKRDGNREWLATSLETTHRGFKYHRVADDEGQTTGSSNRTERDASTIQPSSSTYGETPSAFTDPTENQTNQWF